MEKNLLGLIYSVLFLIAVLVFARLLVVFFPSMSSETVRKFVHIGVSNWWFILVAYMDIFYVRLIGPIGFIILNSLATFLEWAKLFGANDKSRNYGLIHFPISLVVVICLIHWKVIPEFAGGIGVLVMGYGDGLAGIIGRKFGKTKIKHRLTGQKTIVGSAAMFITSSIVIALFSKSYSLHYNALKTLAIAGCATALELFTPLGLDNLTVPIATALLAGKL